MSRLGMTMRKQAAAHLVEVRQRGAQADGGRQPASSERAGLSGVDRGQYLQRVV